MKKRKRNLITERLMETFQLPQDLRKGDFLLSMQGRDRICIENFSRILVFTAEEIRLSTAEDVICIKGCGMKAGVFTRDEIEITGEIDSIRFCRR